jgi:hypothetical protein
MGEKVSRLLEIDMQSGEILQEFGTSQLIRKPSRANSFVIGRNDYVIRAFDSSTGAEEVGEEAGGIIMRAHTLWFDFVVAV